MEVSWKLYFVVYSNLKTPIRSVGKRPYDMAFSLVQVGFFISSEREQSRLYVA